MLHLPNSSSMLALCLHIYTLPLIYATSSLGVSSPIKKPKCLYSSPAICKCQKIKLRDAGLDHVFDIDRKRLGVGCLFLLMTPICTERILTTLSPPLAGNEVAVFVSVSHAVYAVCEVLFLFLLLYSVCGSCRTILSFGFQRVVSWVSWWLLYA